MYFLFAERESTKEKRPSTPAKLATAAGVPGTSTPKVAGEYHSFGSRYAPVGVTVVLTFTVHTRATLALKGENRKPRALSGPSPQPPQPREIGRASCRER